MQIRFDKIIALIVSIVIIGIAFISFAIHIVSSSLPQEFEELKSQSIGSEVKVYKNDYGIPHIISSSDRDMFVALGYCQAQDRLWQIEYSRRLANGELSEILGEEYLRTDKFMRAIDIKTIAKKIYASMDGESRSALESFSKGINLYLEKHSKNLPFEFGYLGYSPQKWKPEDCISIYRLYALNLSIGFKSDLIMGEISDRIGVDKAKALIPDYPYTAPYIYEKSPTANKVIDSLKTDSFKPILANNNNIQIDYELNKVMTIIGSTSSSIGSNAWAVNKIKNNKRNAVLANDPHQTLTNPAVWYQAKMTSPTMNSVGLMLAGTPLNIIGRNDYISWGIVNAMADDCDFFIEKIAPDNSSKYISSDSSAKKFKLEIDTIKVKGIPDYCYYQRSTDRSAVISDFHLNNKKDIYFKNKPMNDPNSSNFYEKHCITFRWTGQNVSNEVSALLSINKAKNFEQFKKAVYKWKSPVLNFIFADNTGNIALLTGGSIPVRDNLANPTLPNPGWLKGYNWNSYINNEELPVLVNPDSCYLYAANNKFFHSVNKFISNYWDNPSRATRIDSLMKQVYKYSARDAQIMQYDLLSPYSKQILNIALPIIVKNYTSLSLTEKRAYERLIRWDNIMHYEVPSTAIFNEFYLALLRTIFKDCLGEYFNKYIDLNNFASIKLFEILENQNSVFIKNHPNSKFRTLDNIILYSFRNSIDSLKTFYGNDDVASWKYGTAHFLEIKHQFAKNPFLKPSFTLERFAIGGNGTTINNTEFIPSSNSKEVSIGASCRFIADMSEKFVYFSIPGGSSGQLYSDNYSDQLQLWLYGGYVKMSTSKFPEENRKPNIVIKPGVVE
jgi:penicillin G amidase